MLVTHLLVAIRADEENGQVVNPPPDDAQQVQCRLVCPVQIIEHDHARRIAGLSQQCQEGIEDSIPVHRVERFSQGAVDLVRDVDQRSEGPSRNDGIARAPQHSNITCRIRAEGFDESGLADAGLATDEDEMTSSMPAFNQQVA